MDATALTAGIWALRGQLDENDTVRDVPICRVPFYTGRRPDTHLPIPSRTVSKIHAQIDARGEQLVLTDLGSTNGTFLNGERIFGDAKLRDGDLVQFADVVFRLHRFDPAPNPETLQGDGCERALALIQVDRLLSEETVVPHFQPIIRGRDQRVVGYEVLGRSAYETLKTPWLMFHTAAQLNLECELSRLCRKVGMRVGAALPADAAIYLNTHPSELTDSDALHRSLRELRQSFPEKRITLEVHEAAVTNSQSMRTLKATLDELAIELAYDDFGDGQARLAELSDVPPHVLKFDISLIRGVDQASPQRRRMLTSLVQMVRELDIQPLAEGMETETEAAACAECGFELYQGFYYSKPVPYEAIRASS